VWAIAVGAVLSNSDALSRRGPFGTGPTWLMRLFFLQFACPKEERAGSAPRLRQPGPQARRLSPSEGPAALLGSAPLPKRPTVAGGEIERPVQGSDFRPGGGRGCS